MEVDGYETDERRCLVTGVGTDTFSLLDLYIQVPPSGCLRVIIQMVHMKNGGNLPSPENHLTKFDYIVQHIALFTQDFYQDLKTKNEQIFYAATPISLRNPPPLSC